MKGSKVFSIVIYYLFTFTIGILLAWGLPKYYGDFQVRGDYLQQTVAEGNFDLAMACASNIYNKNRVLDVQFPQGGGLVLYQSILQYNDVSGASDGNAAEGPKLLDKQLYKAIVGFMYGVDDGYRVFSVQNNQTKLIVDTDSGAKQIELLDYDTNDDGINDGISTYTQHRLIIVEIPLNGISQINGLTFTDYQGATFYSTDAAISCQSDFFDIYSDINEYNDFVRLYTETSDRDERKAANDALVTMFGEYQNKTTANPDYVFISNENKNTVPEYVEMNSAVIKASNRKAVPIIIIYFVCVYIIGDFLLGTHYIIKFFRWLLFDVFKIKRKNKPPKVNRDEVFGHDYYSQVTLSLDTSDVPEFNGSVEIKYTNSDSEVKFTLLKAENYTATQRIKAGVYVNPFIDIDRNYAPVDLPDNFQVEGYRLDKTVKIVRRNTGNSAQNRSDKPTDVTSEQPDNPSQVAEQTENK